MFNNQPPNVTGKCGGVRGMLKAPPPYAPPDALSAGKGGGVGGMLKAVIDTVIGNLQLSISNVHIRWVPNQPGGRRVV